MTNTTPTSDSTPEDIKRYVAKLQALLRHAEDRAGTPEGDAFQAKAFELMQKYGIDAATAAVASDTSRAATEHLVRRVIPIHSVYAEQLLRLGVGIANAVPGAHPLVGGKGTERYLFVYGYESAVYSVNVLFASLRNQILGDLKSQRGWKRALRARPALIHKTSMQRFVWRRDYVLGFAFEVSRRLREAYDVVISDSTSKIGTGAALAVRDRNAPARDMAHAEATGEAKTSKLRSRDTSAITDGIITGRSALIGTDSSTLSSAGHGELT